MADFIGTLAELIEVSERNNFVIFGSSAIVLHGVDLRRPVDDLDVFVAETTFSKLATRFVQQTKPGNEGPVSFYAPAPHIEILKSFPGVSFEEVAREALPLSNSADFPVGALSHLKAWKTVQGRAKDLSDIERIEAYLRQSN